MNLILQDNSHTLARLGQVKESLQVLSKAGTENSGCIEKFKIPKRDYQNLRGARRLAKETRPTTLLVTVWLEVSSKKQKSKKN